MVGTHTRPKKVTRLRSLNDKGAECDSDVITKVEAIAEAKAI